MGAGLKRTLSITTVCLSSLGVLFSVFILIQVWRFQQPLDNQLQTQLDQFSGTLHTTDDALVIIDNLVKNVYTSTIYLDDTTTALSQTLANTNQFIDSASVFIGDNLISTITNTQAALNSAQASAKVIDNILTTLSRIPLIGVDYNPELPLNVALGDVSSSLDPLPEVLINFQMSLKTTYSDLNGFVGQINALDQNITSIIQAMEQAKVTISDYHTQLSSLITLVDDAKENLHTWLNRMTWILTAIILWLFITQLTILFQGLVFLAPSSSERGNEIEKQPTSQDQDAGSNNE
jgi:ABC-type transporter Mla subunit MlaD